jgi:hypothetical protein
VEEGFLAEDVGHCFFHLCGDGIGWDLNDLDGSTGSSDHSLVVADDDVGGNQGREPLKELPRKGLRARQRPGVIDQLERSSQIALRESRHRFTLGQVTAVEKLDARVSSRG